MRVQIGEYMVQVWRGELPGHFSSLSDLADLEPARAEALEHLCRAAL